MRATALIVLSAAGLAMGSVAQADTTVYGSVRIAETWTDIDDSSNLTTGAEIAGEDFWDTTNETSRLGFRGSEELGNGLAAIYHYEFGVDAADTADVGGEDVGGRLSYVGLQGGFGQLTIGRQWNPYYFAVAGEIDWFNGVNSGNGYFSNGGVSRSGNLLVYSTPDWSGVTVQGAVESDGAAGSDGADVWELAAIYNNSPLFLGAGWRQTSKDVLLTDDDFDQYGVQARYSFGAFLLAGSWQRTDDGSNEVDNYDLVGSLSIGNNALSIGYFDTDDTVDGWIVGLEHSLSKRSRLWIEYGDNNFDDSVTGIDPDTGDILEAADVANLSIGMRHDF